MTKTFEQECADIDRRIDNFAECMKAKMHLKVAKGYYGWDSDRFHDAINTKMLEHAAKLFAGDSDQAVDVANLAMMLFRKQR